MAPKFDPTINLGHLLTFGGVILTGVAAYYSVKSDLSVMDTRLKSVEGIMVKMTEMLVTDARQDGRISNLEKWRDRVEVETRP